jgi:hypothetical protein
MLYHREANGRVHRVSFSTSDFEIRCAFRSTKAKWQYQPGIAPELPSLTTAGRSSLSRQESISKTEHRIYYIEYRETPGQETSRRATTVLPQCHLLSVGLWTPVSLYRSSKSILRPFSKNRGSTASESQRPGMWVRGFQSQS